MSHDSISIRVTDRQDIPLLSVIFGYGPMLPFVGGAILGWVGPEPWRGTVLKATILWGCAILLFLAGVRRGVSFRMPDGPTLAQMATMLWLFCVGLVALGAFALQIPVVALVGLTVGFGSVGVLDPIAAGSGEAPGFFAKLRPTQMAIPVITLLALLPLAAHITG